MLCYCMHKNVILKTHYYHVNMLFIVILILVIYFLLYHTIILYIYILTYLCKIINVSMILYLFMCRLIESYVVCSGAIIGSIGFAINRALGFGGALTSDSQYFLYNLQ